MVAVPTNMVLPSFAILADFILGWGSPLWESLGSKGHVKAGSLWYSTVSEAMVWRKVQRQGLPRPWFPSPCLRHTAVLNLLALTHFPLIFQLSWCILKLPHRKAPENYFATQVSCNYAYYEEPDQIPWLRPIWNLLDFYASVLPMMATFYSPRL